MHQLPCQSTQPHDKGDNVQLVVSHIITPPKNSYLLLLTGHQQGATQGNPLHQNNSSSWCLIMDDTFSHWIHKSKFCTCHDSSAVVACAKLWLDWLIRIKIKANRIFTIISFMKQSLDPPASLIRVPLRTPHRWPQTRQGRCQHLPGLSDESQRTIINPQSEQHQGDPLAWSILCHAGRDYEVSTVSYHGHCFQIYRPMPAA